MRPPERYCERHRLEKIEEKRAWNREFNNQRGSSTKQGYGARWRRARKQHLIANPVCVECEREGIVRAAAEVDHITPHRGDYDLFWDESNWQSLCEPHHKSKTAKEVFHGR